MVASLTVARSMVDAAVPLPITTRSDEAVVVREDERVEVRVPDDPDDEVADAVTLDGELPDDTSELLAEEDAAELEASALVEDALSVVGSAVDVLAAVASVVGALDEVGVSETTDEVVGAVADVVGSLDEVETTSLLDVADGVVSTEDVVGAADVVGALVADVEVAEGVSVGDVVVDATAVVAVVAESDALWLAPVLRFGETCLFGSIPRGGIPAVATDMMRNMANARSVNRGS